MKFLLTLALLFSSCAGMTARQEILIPAMRVSWIAISKNVEQGIDAALSTADITPVEAAGFRSEIIAMDSALASREIMRIVDVNWHRLRRLAAQGIEARRARGEIGWGVAKILNDRLAKFNEAYSALLGAL